MQFQFNDITPEEFLAHYWQQKPLLIRQGLSNFIDFLSPDELAGLACETFVESRRIYQKEGEWQAEFGPFDSYDHLGESDWSLVVQAANNWIPDLNQLVECFHFIPRWRFDDVMVSFATPGGGVGPHIDLYDVFICQGSGSRRWRVGNRGQHKEFSAHSALLHTEDFEAIIDVELESGDILYLPPGFPHEGVALENSMSYSVGFRTASAQDMFGALADYLLDHDLAKQQIEDPARKLCINSGKIDSKDFERIKQSLLNTLNDELISQFTGCFLTHPKCELDLPEENPEYPLDEILANLQHHTLSKLGGLRCLYFENTVEQGIFYINGEQIELPAELATVIPLLCDTSTLNLQDLSQWLDQTQFLELLTSWVNNGYWYFDIAED